MSPMKPIQELPALCQDLRELERQRACNLKSRIMIENRLCATVATATGYHAGMLPKDREKRFKAATKLIQDVRSDERNETDSTVAPLILAASAGIDGFDAQIKAYEKEMTKLAKQLPIHDWVCQRDQRGFGVLTLAKVIGECGDLNNYEAPGKLWRRMGCAPFESKGKMQMPSTWRRTKGLSSEEWEECGYSPRRRALAYLIGTGLIKQNGRDSDAVIARKMEEGIQPNLIAGPYKMRYDLAKARAAELHPEWIFCNPCEGSGKNNKGGTCDNCKGKGEVWMHCHNHAMLLMSKLLLKELWIAWTGSESQRETECGSATQSACA